MQNNSINKGIFNYLGTHAGIPVWKYVVASNYIVNFEH